MNDIEPLTIDIIRNLKGMKRTIAIEQYHETLNKQRKQDIKEYNRIMFKIYKFKNPEKIKEYSKKAYQKNKEKRIVYAKIYNKTHRENQIKKSQEYYQRNKEKILMERKQKYKLKKEEKQ